MQYWTWGAVSYCKWTFKKEIQCIKTKQASSLSMIIYIFYYNLLPSAPTVIIKRKNYKFLASNQLLRLTQDKMFLFWIIHRRASCGGGQSRKKVPGGGGGQICRPKRARRKSRAEETTAANPGKVGKVAIWGGRVDGGSRKEHKMGMLTEGLCLNRKPKLYQTDRSPPRTDTNSWFDLTHINDGFFNQQP